MRIPNAAARIGDRIDAAEAHAIDVKAACSGWFTGLELADAFLQTGRAERMLVCAGELSRDCVDPTDRLAVIYFGDGSASGVVSRERPDVGLEVIDFERQSNNHLHEAVEIPAVGTFRTDARATRAWVEEAISAVADRLLKRHDLTADDLRALVCHQANLRLIEYVAEQLGVDEERHWHNVEWAGNTGAVGAPSALFEGIDRNIDDLRDGDLILVVTVGSGLNAVGVLLRWVSDKG
jgi:3-oxoacyl-[acyl-carrier-protein] synthase-3